MELDEGHVVLVDPHAEEDIARINAWWAANRPAAPHLFADELAEVLSLLATSPEMGHVYRRRGLPGLRRVLLRASHEHVYYVFDGRTVLVLTVWKAVGRRGPSFKKR